MPRYFFHVHDGTEVPDQDGVELVDTNEARVQAVIASGEALKDLKGAFWKEGEWRMRVLHPRPGAVGRVGDPNEASLVVEASARGASVLLTGDAESPQLVGLARPVDVLKVGHHGSSDEGLARLLGRLRPRTAVISAGAGNRHGHPHPATLAALAAADARVLRTDRDGDVTVTAASGGGGCGATRCP